MPSKRSFARGERFMDGLQNNSNLQPQKAYKAQPRFCAFCPLAPDIAQKNTATTFV
jgi:hypothetical protein